MSARRLSWVLLVLAACHKPAPRAAALAVPATVPTALPVAELTGAAACAECHAAIYQAWKQSPHGRSMALPAAGAVLGNFDAGTVTLPSGTVTLSHDADAYYMTLHSAGGDERRKVDLVLASGRQHQLYVAHGADGSYSLLPALWSTWTHEWLPLSLYQPDSDLDPGSQHYWGRFDMTGGCFNCHLSQVYRRTGPRPETRWGDLSINCESCHGPGRRHIEHRRSGQGLDPYRSLHALGSQEDARLCGQCHGFALKPYLLPRLADALPQVFPSSLINPSIRPDGTQGGTSYQYPGHVLSECFRKGAGSFTCKSCHQPHALTPQDFAGDSAAGADSNRQCTICHRNRMAAAAAAAHSHHAAAIRCVDCHMAMSWVGGSEARKQRTSDHSISIPRPRESLALGTPNACTTCHQDRTSEWALGALSSWGYSQATLVRPWVETVALARRRAPGATDRLLALLGDPGAGKFLQASALDLLALQPPEARLVAQLAPFAADPDPNLRALAIRALSALDPAGAAGWQARGLADPHPFVRMETFALIKDVAALPAAAIARDLADTLAYKALTAQGLVHLITVRHRRGELREALALVELLDQIALPHEKQSLHLDEVRARIQSDLAKR